MKRHYDFIFCAGRACIATQAVRRAGLQFATFPWDWIGDPGVSERIGYICSDFAAWPRLEDLEWRQAPELFANRKHVICRRTKLFFLHDFDPAKTIEEQYPVFAAKYERRIKRLYDCIRSSKNVLVVCVDSPHMKDQTPLDEGRRCRKALAEKFKGISFDFLQMTIEPGVRFEDRVDEEVEDGFFHIAYDYRDLSAPRTANAIRLDEVAKLLASRFSVRDYRTDAERKSYAERRKSQREERLKARMEKFGATTRAQYEWRRLCKFFRAVVCAVGPRGLAARLRRRKFDQIVSMGVNCEVGFRFFRRWGFVDSSPFVWAQSINLATLTATLRDLDAYCTGEVVFNAKHMWQCRNTGIWMHGQLKQQPGDPLPPDDVLAKDLADLRGRTAHLKEKLLRYLSNDKPTLLVHRLIEADQVAEDLPARVAAFERAVADLGARNCKFLFVYERRRPCNLTETADRYVRSVKAFNPGNRITWEELGDPVGWHAVFTEFAPAKILPKAHAFKFE